MMKEELIKINLLIEESYTRLRLINFHDAVSHQQSNALKSLFEAKEKINYLLSQEYFYIDKNSK